MHKPTFKVQIITELVIIAVCIALTEITHNGIFQKLEWFLIGIMWIVNPVMPKSLHSVYHEKMKKGMIIAGAIMAAMGIFGRFGV